MNNPDEIPKARRPLRTIVGNACIWIVALALAISVGGNVFQMVVVDPAWSASPPASLQNYFGDLSRYEALRRFHVNPVFMFAQVCLVAAVILHWREGSLRRWLLAALVMQLVIIIGTIFYVYPINDVLMVHAAQEVSAASAAELTRHWLVADRLRLVLKFAVLVSVFRALQLSGAPSRARTNA